MNLRLTDYEDPAAAVDPYAPPHDTEPIQPLRTMRYAVPFGIGAALLILLMIGMASYQLAGLAAKPLAIEQPTEIAQAFQSTPVTSQDGPGAAEAQKAATISAYAAPDGALLGPIELDRMMRPVAHYGSAWIQADVEGSGLVWLRAADVPDLAMTGLDLSPRAAPPMTGQGLTAEQGDGNPDAWTPPPATPEFAPPPDVQLVVTGDNDQHTTVIGSDACKVASGARRCGK